MFDWPKLVIMIITYNRIEELTKTVTALHNLIKYPLDKTLWVIADDCSPGDYKDKIIQLWKDGGFPTTATIVSPESNGGWAVNANNALLQFRDYPVYFQEDDYLPKSPIDLMAGVGLLRKAPHIGMLRYRGTAGARFTYHQDEVDITSMYPDFYSGEGAQGKLNYLEIDAQSPTLYLYSHGPHLKSRSWHTFYGLYPEGLKLGATEEHTAHLVKDQMQADNAPRIAILPDFVEMRFDHIGKSYQHTELDKGAG